MNSEDKVLAAYKVSSYGVPAEVAIVRRSGELIDLYELRRAKLKEATRVALGFLKQKVVESVPIKLSELLDPREADILKKKVQEKASEIVKREFGALLPQEEAVLVGKLVQEMLGLGDIELLLSDENLEEIVVNSAREPVWVYHKQFGWLKSNVFIQSEEQILNYSAIIARKVGKQINNLAPLMDANLLSGDRVNATLFPISTKGNSITIRKFAKDPWTMASLVESNTLNLEVGALCWLATQYELNILVGGGTASGKTSLLNAILAFTPPNQRIISLEDTREIVLHDFLHWTPMATRQPNPEGKGGVELLDLMVNALRMRPDRIVLGEIRREREAEVLFEAMHTGHAVYSTVHADSVAQVKNRLTNPPINLPESVLSALHLVIVQYRQRRTGVRRTFQVAEVVPHGDKVNFNVAYSWDARQDKLVQVSKLSKSFEYLSLHTGWSEKEILADLGEKQNLLGSMVKHKVFKIEQVGRISAEYYRNPEAVLDLVKKDKGFADVLGDVTQK